MLTKQGTDPKNCNKALYQSTLVISSLPLYKPRSKCYIDHNTLSPQNDRLNHPPPIYCRARKSSLSIDETQVFDLLTNHIHFPLNVPSSVGQLVIDALAQRLGIRMASARGGYSGQGSALIGNTLVNLTLFKSSACLNCSWIFFCVPKYLLKNLS